MIGGYIFFLSKRWLGRSGDLGEEIYSIFLKSYMGVGGGGKIRKKKIMISKGFAYQRKRTMDREKKLSLVKVIFEQQSEEKT